MRYETKTRSRHPERQRTLVWRAFGYRLEVTYEISPFVARWGYRPLAMLVGFLGALCGLAVLS